jgi:hypothetical protein
MLLSALGLSFWGAKERGGTSQIGETYVTRSAADVGNEMLADASRFLFCFEEQQAIEEHHQQQADVPPASLAVLPHSLSYFLSRDYLSPQNNDIIKMMSLVRKSGALRRFLQMNGVTRNFGSTSMLASDALDMCDTFSRRHCEYTYIPNNLISSNS